MRKQIFKIFLFLAIFLMLPDLVQAAPVITGINGTVSNGQSMTISGSEFGTKAIAAPKYFNDLENESIGQVPVDQMQNPGHQQGTVEENRPYQGAKSLEFDYCADAAGINWQSGYMIGYKLDSLIVYNNSIFKVISPIAGGTITPDLDTEHYLFYDSYSDWSISGVYTVDQIVRLSGTFYTVKASVGPSGLTPKQDSVHYSTRMPWSYCAEGKSQQGDWQRNVVDLGTDGSDKIFLSLWLYVDKGLSTSLSWQWKNLFVTSNSNYYYTLGPTESTLGFEFWHFDNNRWGNSGAPNLYYWDYTAVPEKSVLSFNLGAANDFYLCFSRKTPGV